MCIYVHGSAIVLWCYEMLLRHFFTAAGTPGLVRKEEHEEFWSILLALPGSNMQFDLIDSRVLHLIQLSVMILYILCDTFIASLFFGHLIKSGCVDLDAKGAEASYIIC